MQENIEITLPYSGYKAYLKPRLTYGEKIAIEAVLCAKAEDKKIMQDIRDKGDKSSFTMDWKRKKIMTVLVKVMDGEKELAVDDKLLDSLDMEDGVTLEVEVEKIFTFQKKN